MAVVKDIERKTEAAFVSVVDAVTDLNALRVVRANDATKVAQGSIYPCLTVDVWTAQDEDWQTLGTYQLVMVDLTIKTHKQDDPTGTVIGGYVGALRDYLNGGNLVTGLTAAQSVYTVYGVVQEGNDKDDTGTERIRTITLRVHAACV